MEGYSVTEAASVLGVPTERVWELLARGVLSGVPDGESGMRVFLQPRPAPPAVEEPRRSNGHSNARETDGEASPFRELLTEFRGLTERYGQALLALGEARGEVASLRSRVDVLEARMDLRLPYASPPSSDPGWSGPPRTSSEPPPRVPEHADAEVHDEHEVERSARRKRGRGHATDEFADALARAEDPSPAVLRDRVRGAPAAAAQPDSHGGIAEADVADAGLPRELPPAETMADIEPEAEPAIAEPEAMSPEPEADGAPELEAEVELGAAAEVVAGPEPEPVPEPETETAAQLTTEPQPLQGPEPEAALEPTVDSEIELQPDLDAFPGAEAALESDLGPAAEPVAGEAPGAEVEIEPAPEYLEPEPVSTAEVTPEPEPEAEPTFERGTEPEPVAAERTQDEVVVVPEPEAEPEPAAADAEPSLAPDVDEQREGELELEPEPPVVGALDAVAVDEQETEAELEPADVEPSGDPQPVSEAETEAATAEADEGTSPEPSWDQERYSAQIEEPDWWTPEESFWAEPGVASEPESAQSAPDEPAPAVADSDESAGPSDAVNPPAPPGDEPAAPQAHEQRSSVEAEVAAAPPESVATEGSSESFAGEETMLRFGRRPASSASGEAPSDDAASEMEVASTGRRGWVSSEETSGGMPGAQELDDALVGLDALRRRTAPTAVEPKDPLTAATPAPGRPSNPPDSTAGAPSVVSAELRGPASRAYRRLRRIFPT